MSSPLENAIEVLNEAREAKNADHFCIEGFSNRAHLRKYDPDLKRLSYRGYNVILLSHELEQIDSIVKNALNRSINESYENVRKIANELLEEAEVE